MGELTPERHELVATQARSLSFLQMPDVLRLLGLALGTREPGGQNSPYKHFRNLENLAHMVTCIACLAERPLRSQGMSPYHVFWHSPS